MQSFLKYLMGFLILVLVSILSLKPLKLWPKQDTTLRNISEPIDIQVNSSYKLYPSNGVQYKRYNNVGLTYYALNDGYTPGVITRSGRYVYDGAIAVSQNLLYKEAYPGDVIWVKATNRYYRVEDSMHAKYQENRVDIFTHDMALAKSGSSKTDIIIIRMPR